MDNAMQMEIWQIYLKFKKAIFLQGLTAINNQTVYLNLLNHNNVYPAKNKMENASNVNTISSLQNVNNVKLDIIYNKIIVKLIIHVLNALKDVNNAKIQKGVYLANFQEYQSKIYVNVLKVIQITYLNVKNVLKIVKTALLLIDVKYVIKIIKQINMENVFQKNKVLLMRIFTYYLYHQVYFQHYYLYF